MEISNHQNEHPARPWLLCRAGSRLCALPLGLVVETMRPLPIDALPGAPDFVAGLSIIRGAPVPVVDTARLFGETTAQHRRLVACAVGGRRIALAVEEVAGVAAFAEAETAALPPLLGAADGAAIERLRVLDGEVLLLLDAARLAAEVPEAAA